MSAKDAAVLSTLGKAGSQLDLPHPIRHYLYLPDQARAEDAAASLRKDGFEAKVSPAAIGDQWLVLTTHTMIPSLVNIAGARARFEKLASECNGEYDGWEAGIVRRA